MDPERKPEENLKPLNVNRKHDSQIHNFWTPNPKTSQTKRSVREMFTLLGHFFEKKKETKIVQTYI